MRDLILEFSHIVEQNNSFLIISHNKPDGDTLGANLALRKALLRKEKKVVSACYDELPDYGKFLPDSKEIVQDFILEDFDVVIVVDTATKKLVGFFEKFPELNRTRKPIICIDHHASGEPFGTLNIIDEQATSTTSLLIDIFQELSWSIDSDMATCLLNGIYTDTGSFMHSNTTKKVLQQSAILSKIGADYKLIQKNNFQKTNLRKLKLMGEILSNIEVDEQGVVQSGVRKLTLDKYKATSDDLTGVADMICSIPNTEYSILFTETDQGLIKASLRTRREDVNVAKVAESYGGGGHTKAAGFRVQGSLNKKTIWGFDQLPKQKD